MPIPHGTRNLPRGFRVPQQRAMRQPKGIAYTSFRHRASFNAAASLTIQRIAVERVRIKRRTRHSLRRQGAMKLIARPAHACGVDAA